MYAKTHGGDSHATTCLPNISAYFLGGKKLDDNFSAWGAVGLNFNPKKKTLDNYQLLIGGSESKHKAKLQAEVSFNRVDEEADKHHFAPSLQVLLDSQLHKDHRFAANIEYDHSKKNTKVALVHETQLDSNTRFKTKINENYFITFGLAHKFSANLNFALTSNINWVTKAEDKNAHLRYRFGAAIELIDV